MSKQELIAAVRAHAEANYEKDGWDFLVECWEDEDIAEWMGNAATAEQAIAGCRRTVRTLAEQRRSVQNEAW